MTTKILLTGGAGGIGRFAVAHFIQQGYAVRVIDQMPEQVLSADVVQLFAGADYQQVDLLDLEKLTAVCADIDAIVHLAGIPQLFLDRTSQIFQVNVGGTFNLYTAAAANKIERVVAASSINFLGNGFGQRLIDIAYFPIDEAHPGFATDAYAFSKQMLEEVATYFWRSAAISSICFRFPVVYTPLWMSSDYVSFILQKARADFAMMMALPEAKRMKEIGRLKAHYLTLRQERSAGQISYSDIFAFYDQTPGAMLLREFDNFWAVLTVWDAVRALETAVRASWTGVHPLYVAEADNGLGLPTKALVQLLYPEVTQWKRPLSGTASLLNTIRAQTLLNFTPTRSQIDISH